MPTFSFDPMKTKESKTYPNPYRVSAPTVLEWEGVDVGNEESVYDYVRSAGFEGTAPACCTEGCIVEPDGRCPHGCPSGLIVLGVI
jgi:hypothetical protein